LTKISVYLPKQLKQKVKQLCKKYNLSMSAFIRSILLLYLEGKQGPSHVISHVIYSKKTIKKEISKRLKQRNLDPNLHFQLMNEIKKILASRKVV